MTKLSRLDKAFLQNLQQNGHFAFAYEYIKKKILEGTPEYIWFENAAKINAGVGPALFSPENKRILAMRSAIFHRLIRR